MTYDYDTLVLGAGPGGYQAAACAARHGLKTALIEARELGGTCLNRGCIPTKALLEGARVWETVGDAATFGIRAEGRALDYAALCAYKDKQVKKLRMGVEALEKALHVDVKHSHGRLTDAHTVCVGDEPLTARTIILATGSAPARIPIPGAEFAMTSDDVLAMTSLPPSAVIIGGGVIGVEFATLLSTLGCEVTLLEMTASLLPGMDAAISTPLTTALKKKKVRVALSARVASIGADGTVAYMTGDEQKQARGDITVMCTGRVPMTRGIGLEQAGVALTPRGYVITDEHMQTSVSGIYAVGDITGHVQLAHAADKQGRIAAENCAGANETYDERVIPACVYAHPEVACVGLTENAARAACANVRIGTANVAANGRATVMNERAGFARLITDGDSGLILGAQLMGPRATDMIAEIAVAMRAGFTARDIARTVHPHPTVSEMVMEAARDAAGQNAPACAR